MDIDSPPPDRLDAIIILGKILMPDGTLDWTLESNVRHAVALFSSHPEARLVLSGGLSYTEKEAKKSEAEAMFSFIKDNYPSLDLSRVILEPGADSTIENAYFVKTKNAIPGNWKTIALVADEFFVRRVSVIFKAMFGDQFQIFPVPVPLRLAGKQRDAIKEFEDRFLVFYQETVSLYKNGDHEAFLDHQMRYKQERLKQMAQGSSRLETIEIKKPKS